MKASAVLRAGWNLLDQVVSSATNAILSFLIARSVTESDFGGFSVAFTIFSLFIGVSRAVAATPLSIRFSGSGPDEFSRATASGVGTALVIGAVGGVGCLSAGAFVGGAAGAALLALGIVLPGLLVQDAWRLVFFAESRPQAAVVNDVFWAILQIGAVIALVVLELDQVGLLTLAWGLSACAAAVLGMRQSGVRPLPALALRWLRDHRDLTKYLLLEYVTLQSGQQLAMLAIASIGSLSAVGALRGVQVLLGPTTILLVGMYSFALPEFSRRRNTLTMKKWLVAAVSLSAFVAVLGAVWGGLFLFLPDSIGEQLLGQTWSGAKGVLVATIVGQAGSALSLGPATMLYAMDRAKVTLSIHAWLAPLLLLGGVGGVLLGGAVGAAWGFAGAFWAVLPAWWIKIVREARTLAAANATAG